MRKTVQIYKILEKEFPNLELTAIALGKMEWFLQVLRQWNTKMNLTAIQSEERQFAKHILDPLALYKYPTICEILSGKILDMGSGAGIPGIVLSIVDPGLEIASVDKSEKKIIFQQHVKSQLQLFHFNPMTNRLESLAKNANHTAQYDIVVSRAFSRLTTLLRYGGVFLKSGGKLVLWKGKRWREEYRSIPDDVKEQFPTVFENRYHFKKYNIGGSILVFPRNDLPQKPTSG